MFVDPVNVVEECTTSGLASLKLGLHDSTVVVQSQVLLSNESDAFHLLQFG